MIDIVRLGEHLDLDRENVRDFTHEDAMPSIDHVDWGCPDGPWPCKTLDSRPTSTESSVRIDGPSYTSVIELVIAAVYMISKLGPGPGGFEMADFDTLPTQYSIRPHS